MVPLRPVDRLDAETSSAVIDLAARAAVTDGVRPLSEQSVLDVRRGHSSGADDTPTAHLLVQDEATGELAGYAHVELSEPPAAEVVVAPERRRLGHGTALVAATLTRWPSARFWAHGDLAPARALAQEQGLHPVRDLWQMSRPLAGEWSELPEAPLPEGFTVRAFQEGRDEHAWLRVNARAFADHDEQGRMTLADLEERLAEPWFDAEGFLLVEEHLPDQPARLAGFHWTKVEHAPDGAPTPTSGEVYVVGVDPDYQGRGLGKVVTVLGLAHLRDRHLQTATLYVDGDNEPAISTYHRLDFERSAVDVMYAVGDS